MSQVEEIDAPVGRKLQERITDERRLRLRARFEAACEALEEPPRTPNLLEQMKVLNRPDMLRLRDHLYALNQKGENLITAPINRTARRVIKSLMRPTPRLTVKEFVEHKVMGWDMSDGPIPGKVKLSNQQICESIVLTLNEPGVSSVAVCMSPQMCKTFVLQCLYAYAMGVLNTTVMIVMPNDAELKPFVYGKLNKMIADFPSLKRIVHPKKNGLYFKAWTGGFGVQTNAGSDTNLGGKTIQIVLVDEVDKMGITKSGDPVDLAFARSLAYKDSGFNYQSCTPTHEKGRIWQAFLNGDRRRYFIKCPNPTCGHEQVPIWCETPKPDMPMSDLFVRWDEDGTETPIPGTCRYHCQKCDHAFSEAQRQRALRQGTMRQTREFTCCGERQDPMERYREDGAAVWDHDHWPAVGYALCRHSRLADGSLNHECNSVKKPAVENLPGSAVTNGTPTFHGWHVQAQTIKMDRLALDYKTRTWRSFMNNNLGLPFLDSEVTGLEAESMMDRLELYYTAAELNDRSVVLTAGIDVQQGYLAIVILAWGPGKECWLVHYEEIGRDMSWGDTMKGAVWGHLDDRLSRTWYTKSGRPLKVESACIDTGGGHGRTEQAKEWAWKRQTKMMTEAQRKGKGVAPQLVLAINGARGEDGLNFKDPFPAKVSKLDRTTHGVGKLALNAEILEMLANPRVGTGYAHFTESAIVPHPQREGRWHIAEFFRMLTAEHREVDDETGKTKWVQDRERNEVFDCYAYALSALYAIPRFVKGFSLETRARRMGVPLIVTQDERLATEMSIRGRKGTDDAIDKMDVRKRTVVRKPQRRVRRMPVVVVPGRR